MAQPVRPSIAKMLGRGIRRRCAWCGGRGAFFTGWFAKQETCRTCGISWRRGYEGFELGAMAVSIIICFGALVIGVGIGVAATAPDVAVGPLVVVLIVCAVVLPIIVYPLSYTLWQAIDLAMRPPGPGDAVPPAAP